MKALTLTEPWATLVMLGEKRIETRSWSTAYRGPLAIHAAKGMPRDAEMVCYEEPFLTVLRAHVPRDVIRRQATAWFKRGFVIATAQLVDCLPIALDPIRGQHCVAPDDEGLMRVWHPTSLDGVWGHYSDITTEHEQHFGDYTPGRFGWVLTDIVALPEPLPARGSLGLWNLEVPS